MSSHEGRTGEKLDAIYRKFVLTGLEEQHAAAATDFEALVASQLSDAIDILRGLTAHREGREALAKALQEGLRDGYRAPQ